MKRTYSKEVKTQICIKVNSIIKLNFLKAYPITHAQSYKIETIKNSFIATGLVLFNPNRVIETLNIQLKTLTPPRSRGSDISSLKTPPKPKAIR